MKIDLEAERKADRERPLRKAIDRQLAELAEEARRQHRLDWRCRQLIALAVLFSVVCAAVSIFD